MARAQPKDKSSGKTGRLKALGIDSPDKIALYFPSHYINARMEAIDTDYTNLHDKDGEKVLIGGVLQGDPVTDYSKKPIRTMMTFTDRRGQMIRVTVFGDSRQFVREINHYQRRAVCLQGKLTVWNAQYLYLNTPKIIPRQWVGRIIPVYKGKKGYLTPETIQNKIFDAFEENVERAAAYLLNQYTKTTAFDNGVTIAAFLASDTDKDKILDNRAYLVHLIRSVHRPETEKKGEKAQCYLKRLAAYLTLEAAQKTVYTASHPKAKITLSVDTLTACLPEHITLTPDQYTALNDIVTDLNQDRPMRRLLTGDVGTGKSYPIMLTAIGVASQGKQVVILMPNETLATQMCNDINQLTNLGAELVSNKTKGLPDSHILVGTTALNFRFSKEKPIDYLIIDEQQKLSVEQRNTLTRPYTHILEASATPVPRSLGLIKYGGLKISTLKTCYVKKDIRTRIVENTPDDKKQLLSEIKSGIQKGEQVLIVYPLAELADDENEKNRHTSEGGMALWEKHFPGRVRYIHGKLSSEEKQSAIDAILSREADILCSTTVVEVGLNLPGVKKLMIISPDKLGLNTLHQIRGRLCRAGGQGDCYLYLPKPVQDKTRARLDVIVKHTDGFKIAEEDMRMRGFGDLTQDADEQTGYLEGVLPGVTLELDDIDWASSAMFEKLEKLEKIENREDNVSGVMQNRP